MRATRVSNFLLICAINELLIINKMLGIFFKPYFFFIYLLVGLDKVSFRLLLKPEEYEKIHFKNHYKKLKAPYIIYGDFEYLTTHSKYGIKGTYADENQPNCPKGTY